MQLLKGNFKTKKSPEAQVDEKEENDFSTGFRKKAIENIGGSMVFVERKLMTWDGED